jgi:hypothetical protein
MQIDEMTSPIFIELPNVSKKSARRSLAECFRGDLDDAFEDLVLAYEKLSDEDKTNEEALFGLARNVAEKNGIAEENIDAVSEGLVVKLMRSTNSILMEMNIDVAEYRKLGFDLIVRNHKMNKSILYGDCSKEEAKKLQDILFKQEVEWSNFVKEAKVMNTWEEVKTKFAGTRPLERLKRYRTKIRKEVA